MIVLFAPTPTGGHPLYVHALADALRSVQPRRVVVVTSVDVDPRFRGEDVVAALPALRPRTSYRNRATWVLDRLQHYGRRDAAFVRWVQAQPRTELVHWQEHTPWGLRHQLARLSVPSVVTVHNVVPHAGTHTWGEVAGWRAADALAVHTPALREQLLERLGTCAPPVAVTPHGVWRGPRADRSRFAGRLLVFGALRRDKGIEDAVRTLVGRPTWRLRVVGSGDASYVTELRALAGALGVADRLAVEDRYVPEDEVPHVLADADVLLLPYRGFAAQSGAAHLAIGHGLPFVATAVGGLPELVRAHGLLPCVPSGAGLPSAVAALEDPVVYADAVAAVHRAADDLGWERSARATADVYDALLARVPA